MRRNSSSSSSSPFHQEYARRQEAAAAGDGAAAAAPRRRSSSSSAANAQQRQNRTESPHQNHRQQERQQTHRTASSSSSPYRQQQLQFQQQFQQQQQQDTNSQQANDQSHNNKTQQQQQQTHNFQQRHTHTRTNSSVCIFLVNAGLYMGYDGLVDAYDRGMATGAVRNESTVTARPDIVHQCLLAIFDSELGMSGNAHVFIYTTKGKTIEVSPNLRPPRTYDRFKGLMATLLRDGRVASQPAGDSGGGGGGGRMLMQILQGTIAPMIPEGAEVIGISNASHAPIATPSAVAEHCIDNPVPAQLRGGRKGIGSFFVVDCRDVADAGDEPAVTKLVSLSPYPQSPHVQAMRLCEGFRFVEVARQRKAEAEEERKQQQLQQKERQQKQDAKASKQRRLSVNQNENNNNDNDDDDDDNNSQQRQNRQQSHQHISVERQRRSGSASSVSRRRRQRDE